MTPNQRYRARYQDCVDRGLCVVCAKEPCRPQRKTCANCAALQVMRRRQWGMKNPERQAEVCRRSRLKCRFGLTPEDFADLVVRQSGKCLICKSQTDLVIDHDHQTGQVRGLLCLACNSGLGLFYDDPIHLQAAIDYLAHA